jgi:hypothetical protein
MTRSLLIAGLLAFLTAGAARAELVCSLPTHAAGEVRGGTALAHSFTLVNRGSAVIEITEVKPGCGCLRPTLERVRFAPGEQGALRIEVNTVTQPAGPNTWKATVRYREGGRDGELTLYVTARLTAEVHIRPASLVLHTATSLAHSFTLIERRPTPLELRSAASSSPHVRVSLTTPTQQDGAWVRTIKLEVLPSCPDGRHDSMLYLHTADSAYAELKVPFTIVKQTPGLVQASPAALHLTSLPGQALPSRIVLLGTADDQPVGVARIETSDPCIRCTWAAGPGPRATLRIQVERELRQEDRFEGSVRVHVHKPAPHVLTIPVRVIR